MADYSNIFTLDDEEIEESGFNDFDAIGNEIEDENKNEEDDPKLIDKTEDKTEVDGSGKDEETGSEETEEDENITKKNEASAGDKENELVNTLVATVAKQTEQLNALQKVSLDKKTNDAPIEIFEPIEKPEFTIEEWELDPVKCTEQLIEYKEKVKERANSITARKFAEEAALRENSLKQAHDIGWQTVIDVMPELNTMENTPLRMRYAYHFEKYKNDPMGTIKAMHDLKVDPVVAKLTGGTIQPTGEQDTITEENRKDRVVQGTMHGRGKGGGQQKISLNQSQKQAAKFMGVSEEAYLETLKAIGGGE